jgi:hypothetical protein
MCNVIMSENQLASPRMLNPYNQAASHTLNHTRVVGRIAKHDTSWHLSRKRTDGRIICNKTTGKDQGRVFPMQSRQLSFKTKMQLCVPTDVSSSASPSAVRFKSFLHGREDGWMLGHSQIVVATPHRNA